MSVSLNNRLFEGLKSEEISEVMRYITITRYRRDHFLFHTGDKPDCIFLLQEGMVKVSYGNLRGEEKTVSLYQAGDIFGDLFLGKYRHRIGIAMALDDVTVGKIAERDLIRLTERFPRVGMNFIRHLADAQRETLARMHALMHLNARSRLLGTLLSLSRRYCCTEEDGWFTVPDCISQEDLAHLTCLNRSTVNVQINKLRKQGILGGTGRTLTVNRPAVIQMLEDAGLEILE